LCTAYRTAAKLKRIAESRNPALKPETCRHKPESQVSEIESRVVESSRETQLIGGVVAILSELCHTSCK
jgi:hypothetical protein